MLTFQQYLEVVSLHSLDRINNNLKNLQPDLAKDIQNEIIIADKVLTMDITRGQTLIVTIKKFPFILSLENGGPLKLSDMFLPDGRPDKFKQREFGLIEPYNKNVGNAWIIVIGKHNNGKENIIDTSYPRCMGLDYDANVLNYYSKQMINYPKTFNLKMSLKKLNRPINNGKADNEMSFNTYLKLKTQYLIKSA